MRQALMMLNGKLTHEASRVGPNESDPRAVKGQRSKTSPRSSVKLTFRFLPENPATKK